MTYTALLDDKCNQYTVSYNGNNPTSGSAPSSNSYTWSSSANRTLSGAGTLAKNGYVFQGWASTQARANSLTVDFCVTITALCREVKTYTDAQINPNNDATVTLYAVWLEKLYMQDVDTVSMCQSMAVGNTMIVFDRRDDNYYTIGKLADGKCWMLQNLRIVNTTISSADSNFTSKTSYTIPASTATGTSTGFDSSTGYTTSAVYAPASNSGATIYSGSDTSSSWATTTDTNDIGVLYNYCVATAETICTGNIATDAYEDICPKGWHLPSANSDTSDFGNLVLQYGATSSTSNFSNSTDAYKKFNNAFRTVLAGNYYSGSLYDSGLNGYYWPSTAHSGTGRYRLVVNPSNVYPADNYNRYYGYSVRCVAKPIMQETTTVESCLKLAEGQTMAVVDKQDGNEYTIRKLADRQCWMLQNLRISTRNTLTSSDTNLANGATYTLPANISYRTGWTGSYTLPEIHISNENDSEIYWCYEDELEEDYDCGRDTVIFNKVSKYSGTTTSASWSTSGITTGLVGVYYNYCAATAGTICMASNATNGKDEAQYDICPKGWHLPSANPATSDFGALAIAYGGNTNGTSSFSSSTDAYKKLNYAFQTVLAGYYDENGLIAPGGYTRFWSSTAGSASYRCSLYVGTPTVDPANRNVSRGDGYSIRCVAP